MLALILGLMLPAFGAIPSGMPAEPCPMQSSMPHQDHALAEAPCCEHRDDAGGASSKSPCKPGYECKTSGILQTAVIKAIAPLHPRAQTPLHQSPIQREPADRWRPPPFA
ncbi:hypothetical protein D3C84_1129040 [compost metagenome]